MTDRAAAVTLPGGEPVPGLGQYFQGDLVADRVAVPPPPRRMAGRWRSTVRRATPVAAASWVHQLTRPGHLDPLEGHDGPADRVHTHTASDAPTDPDADPRHKGFTCFITEKEPGVAEKEFAAQPYEFLSRAYLLYEGQTPVEPPEVTDPRRAAAGGAGWIPGMGEGKHLPAWQSEDCSKDQKQRMP